MMMKKIVCIVAVAALLAFNASPADAAFQVTVLDVDTGHILIGSDGGSGAILVSGPVGEWTVTVSTSFSKPLIGPHRMHLDVVATSGAPGPNLTSTLIVGATDTGFGNFPIGTLLSSVGGSTDGLVDVQAEKDLDNLMYSADFGMDLLNPEVVVAHGPYSGAAFSGSAAVGHGAIAGPYSMTNYIRIVHTAAGQVTSVDHDIEQIPEPSSLAIFGGLLGLGCLWMRRRKK
jgi:hypothetical protein